MELKMNEVKLPEQITFNYEELKTELAERTRDYLNLVYTDETIKDAKSDRAKLNALRKSLNDERIRLEKDYMIPFNSFKTQVAEIIKIIDEPIAAIDKQVKAYEEECKRKKRESIEDYWTIVNLYSWLTLDQIFDQKWLNATKSMKSVQEEIDSKLKKIDEDMKTLLGLQQFGFESAEVYKSTLDIAKALNEGQRLADIQKRKEEAERAKAEHERMIAEREAQAAAERAAVEATERECAVPEKPPVKLYRESDAQEVKKDWVRFAALLSSEDALELKAFFESRGIEFKAV